MDTLSVSLLLLYLLGVAWFIWEVRKMGRRLKYGIEGLTRRQEVVLNNLKHDKKRFEHKKKFFAAVNAGGLQGRVIRLHDRKVLDEGFKIK